MSPFSRIAWLPLVLCAVSAPGSCSAADNPSLRDRLERDGIHVNVFYNHLAAAKNSGGVDGKSGASVSGTSDWIAQWNLEEKGVAHGRFLVHVKADFNSGLNSRVGAWGDPFDDADGTVAYIAQFWYEHNLAHGRFQIRVGYLNQQTALDRNAYANIEDRQFMNEFLDNNTALLPLGITPGVAVFLNPADWVSFVVSMVDANSPFNEFDTQTLFNGDYVTFAEADFRTRLPSKSGALVGTYRFGGFLDSRRFTRPDRPADALHNRGAYVSFDQQVFAEPDAPEQGLGLFFRGGSRPRDRNLVDRFWSAGAQYRGLVSGRSQDVLGIGGYRASDDQAGAESGVECYYAFPVGKSLVVTPAVQYLRRPGGRRDVGNTFLAALRIRLAL